MLLLNLSYMKKAIVYDLEYFIFLTHFVAYLIIISSVFKAKFERETKKFINLNFCLNFVFFPYIKYNVVHETERMKKCRHWNYKVFILKAFKRQANNT